MKRKSIASLMGIVVIVVSAAIFAGCVEKRDLI